MKVTDHDTGSPPYQFACQRQADPARRAGHNRDAPVKFHLANVSRTLCARRGSGFLQGVGNGIGSVEDLTEAGRDLPPQTTTAN